MIPPLRARRDHAGRGVRKGRGRAWTELDEVGEDIGLAAQLVGDHRRLAGDGGDRGDPHAAALGLDYNGYTVVTKATKEFIDASGRRKVKGNMDVELAVDAMELAEH